MRTIPKIFLYFLCTALCVFYISVLYLGAHPHVDEIYRMYFIDKKLRNFPHEQTLDIVLNEMEYLQKNVMVGEKQCRRLDWGWRKFGTDGTWTKENTVHIYFKNISEYQDCYIINFDMTDYDADVKEIMVSLNSNFISSAAVSQKGVYSFKFPSVLISDTEINDITLKITGRIKVSRFWISGSSE